MKAFARWLGAWLLAWGALPPRPCPEPPPISAHQAASLRAILSTPAPDPKVLSAVCSAYMVHGLPPDQFGPKFDLEHAGRFYDVLRCAAACQGIKFRARTVADAVGILERGIR